jgi:hypothetical protein
MLSLRLLLRWNFFFSLCCIELSEAVHCGIAPQFGVIGPWRRILPAVFGILSPDSLVQFFDWSQLQWCPPVPGTLVALLRGYII